MGNKNEKLWIGPFFMKIIEWVVCSENDVIRSNDTKCKNANMYVGDVEWRMIRNW